MSETRLSGLRQPRSSRTSAKRYLACRDFDAAAAGAQIRPLRLQRMAVLANRLHLNGFATVLSHLVPSSDDLVMNTTPSIYLGSGNDRCWGSLRGQCTAFSQCSICGLELVRLGSSFARGRAISLLSISIVRCVGVGKSRLNGGQYWTSYRRGPVRCDRTVPHNHGLCIKPLGRVWMRKRRNELGGL